MKTLALPLLYPVLPHLLVAQQSSTAQNPCEEKQISQRQMDDCADFEYKKADEQLNKVYRKALQYVTDDLAGAQERGDQKQVHYEETAIASLKEAERSWIAYRDIQCKAAAQQYEGGAWRQ